jgi:hypothetical protein
MSQSQDQIIETIVKPPTATRFHGIDLVAKGWLDEGETVTGQTVASDSPDLLVDQAANADGTVSWRVRAGQLGTDPIVTVTVTTSAGRVEPFFVRYQIRRP